MKLRHKQPLNSYKGQTNNDKNEFNDDDFRQQPTPSKKTNLNNSQQIYKYAKILHKFIKNINQQSRLYSPPHTHAHSHPHLRGASQLLALQARGELQGGGLMREQNKELKQHRKIQNKTQARDEHKTTRPYHKKKQTQAFIQTARERKGGPDAGQFGNSLQNNMGKKTLQYKELLAGHREAQRIQGSGQHGGMAFQNNMENLMNMQRMHGLQGMMTPQGMINAMRAGLTQNRNQNTPNGPINGINAQGMNQLNGQSINGGSMNGSNMNPNSGMNQLQQLAQMNLNQLMRFYNQNNVMYNPYQNGYQMMMNQGMMGGQGMMNQGMMGQGMMGQGMMTPNMLASQLMMQRREPAPPSLFNEQVKTFRKQMQDQKNPKTAFALKRSAFHAAIAYKIYLDKLKKKGVNFETLQNVEDIDPTRQARRIKNNAGAKSKEAQKKKK